MDYKKIGVNILLRLISLAIGFLALLYLGFQRWRKGEDFFKVKERPTQPSILGDRKWGNHSFVTLKKQGIKLHYVENGDRSSPLMVCLHGFPECWFSWRHQLAEFSSKFRVVAVDMRGYGDSDKPSGWGAYKTDTLIEDMREFIEIIGDGKKCTLMAHDWGGAIAWQLVDRYPQMFERHISCNAPHFLAMGEVLRNSFTQKRKSWYMLFFQNPYIPEMYLTCEDIKCFDKMFRGKDNKKEAFSDEVLEAFKYYFSQKDAFNYPVNYYRNIDFVGRLSGAPEDVKKIKVPTFIIWGRDDLALDEAIPNATPKYCEDVKLQFVDGAGHWVQQEEPKYVNDRIWEYLDMTK